MKDSPLPFAVFTIGLPKNLAIHLSCQKEIQKNRGTAINTLMGVLILGLISNILNLLNVPSYPQQVVKGGIIIFAVLLQRFEQK